MKLAAEKAQIASLELAGLSRSAWSSNVCRSVSVRFSQSLASRFKSESTPTAPVSAPLNVEIAVSVKASIECSSPSRGASGESTFWALAFLLLRAGSWTSRNSSGFTSFRIQLGDSTERQSDDDGNGSQRSAGRTDLRTELMNWNHSTLLA